MYDVVVDASVAVKWLVAEEDSERAAELLDFKAYQCCVPDFLYGEVVNVIWQHVKSKKMLAPKGLELLRQLKEIPLRVIPTQGLISRAFMIAEQQKLAATYDAIYLACALEENAMLITADYRFYRSIHDSILRRHIELLTPLQ